MELREFVGQIPSFDSLSDPEKIKLFGWYLHVHRERERFTREAIKECYQALHLGPPDIGISLRRLVQRRPAALLKDARGYRLEGKVRSALDKKYGEHESTLVVSKLLKELPNKVPDLAEQVFLKEAVSCYRVRAFRAAIVMAWNLAFDHLLKWILADAARLGRFNAAIAKVYPKKTGVSVGKHEDFQQFKESEVIEVAGSASLFSKDVKKILKEKLDKRNTAAHPSLVTIAEPQANDVVVDLVENVVLMLI
ncbi:MAG TPA: hypothetical protein VFS41_03780 [Edaphobacter sp.]|nr:hypothetical protein [Edaphobacter sp.]